MINQYDQYNKRDKTRSHQKHDQLVAPSWIIGRTLSYYDLITCIKKVLKNGGYFEPRNWTWKSEFTSLQPHPHKKSNGTDYFLGHSPSKQETKSTGSWSQPSLKPIPLQLITLSQVTPALTQTPQTRPLQENRISVAIETICRQSPHHRPLQGHRQPLVLL